MFEREKSEGCYLCLFSPVEKQSGQSSYKKAFESINFELSRLLLPFGKRIAYQHVTDFDVSADGNIHFSGNYFRMPLYADDFGSLDSEIYNEISKRLVFQTENFRTKLQQASNFMALSLRQNDEAFRFSSYWIALEILVGKSNAIRAKLSSAYGENSQFVDNNLYFKRVSDCRHDLMHSGKFGMLPSYFERLLHLFFWDIVMHQIGLPCKRLAESLCLSGLIQLEEANQAKISA